MGFVNATECPFPIFIDDPTANALQIPVGTFELHECWFSQPRLGANDINIVKLADGAVLRNLSKIEGAMQLSGQPTTAPCLVNDPVGPGSPAIFSAFYAAQYTNIGTRPMIDAVGPGAAVFVIGFNSGYKVGNPATSMFGLSAGAFLIAAVIDETANLDPTFVSGPAGTTLAYRQESGGVTFAQLGTPPLFAGTVINVATTTVGGSGPTAFRPTPAFGPVLIGTMYFDTSIAPPGVGRPIWFVDVPASPTGWVDATGAPA